MAHTFRVDDVDLVRGRLADIKIAPAVSDALGVGLLHVSHDATLIDEARHPLLLAVHVAFAEHRQLSLSPDHGWLTLAQAFAFMLAGCDPGVTLKGQLTAPDGGAVVGTTVRTVCSSQNGAMSAISDAHGDFSGSGLGCIGDDCRLEVLVPGKAPLVLPVKKHCQGTVMGCGRGCSHLDVRAVVE